MTAAFERLAEGQPAVDAALGAAHRVREVALRDLDERAWRDLEACASEPNVFAGPDFASAYAAAFGLGDRLRALRVESETGRLDGLFLFLHGFRWGLPVGVATALFHPFAGTSAPLVRRGSEAGVFRAFLTALASGEAGGTAWLFPFLPADGALHDALVASAEANGASTFPFGAFERPVLRPDAGPDDAYPVLAAGRLKRYRQLGRQLAREGELAFETTRDAREIGLATETFLDLEAAGWKGRMGTAARDHPEQAALFRDALPALAAHGRCRVDTLRLDGRPIAAGIALGGPDGAWLWKAAYEEAHGHHSPYIQLAMHQTREMLEAGAPACCDACSAPGPSPVDRIWHQRRPYCDLLVVPNRGLPGPRLASFLEGARRGARARAVALKNRIRPRP